MVDLTNYFARLYDEVLNKEKDFFFVSDSDIYNAISTIHQVYQPDPNWKTTPDSNAIDANYGDPAFRCAYLHKYAACYTGMVYHVFKKAIEGEKEIFTYINKKTINICSLGGGPGTDIVGILGAISEQFVTQSISVTIIDAAKEWCRTFSSVLHELKSESSVLWEKVTSNLISAKYFEANLLSDWWPTIPCIGGAVETADLITMVKFVSAAACCQRTESMISNIFNNMKPGAMLLIIDNAAGGFDEMINTVASRNGMYVMFGPVHHYDYTNFKFSKTRFGFASQYKTKIFFEVFQKPELSQFTKNAQAQMGVIRGEMGEPYYTFESNINKRHYDEETYLLMEVRYKRGIKYRSENAIRVSARKQINDNENNYNCVKILFGLIFYIVFFYFIIDIMRGR